MTAAVQVAERGDPAAPTVLLVHGVGQTHRMWEPQLVPLAERFHVLAPDLPGFGASAGTFTLAAAATALADLLDGAEPAYVCGLSAGAMVALRLAADAPDRVAGLVLSGAQVRPNRLAIGAQLAVMRLLPERVMRGGAGGEVSKATMVAAVRELARADLTDALATVRAPALVMCGGKDRANLPAARRIAAALPDAKLRVVPGAGHVWNLQQPELFTRTVVGFVDRLEHDGRPIP